ncbi:MAG: hypothetical protein R6W77_07310 [Trueperaceae bacterium]
MIPATGPVGLHTLQAISGTHPVPYLNQQQSPNYKPAVPTVLGAVFEVTEGAAVAWAAPAEQYGCGFNSQGDVTIHLKAPGREGVHFISLYPSFYQGQVTGPGAPASPDANATYLQLPMLNHVDHPGEELPAFHLSFEVRR